MERGVFRSGMLIALTAFVVIASVFWSVNSLAAGDTVRGEALYAVCATCHGPKGEGMEEMNGPALAGREAWYLKRQLENFKSGVRGGDSRDIYGLQMAPMAQLLQDEQAVADVLAYLSSLR